jgi:hypothetical protein
MNSFYSLTIFSFQGQTMSTKKSWFFILIVMIIISAFSGRPAIAVTVNEELIKACSENDIDTVRNLLKNGADRLTFCKGRSTDKFKEQPRFHGIRNGNRSLCKRIFKKERGKG